MVPVLNYGCQGQSSCPSPTAHQVTCEQGHLQLLPLPLILSGTKMEVLAVAYSEHSKPRPKHCSSCSAGIYHSLGPHFKAGGSSNVFLAQAQGHNPNSLYNLPSKGSWNFRITGLRVWGKGQAPASAFNVLAWPGSRETGDPPTDFSALALKWPAGNPVNSWPGDRRPGSAVLFHKARLDARPGIL